jgi:hypothetical protein
MNTTDYYPMVISREAFIELQTLAFAIGFETENGPVSPVSLDEALLIAVRAYRALTKTNSLLETDSKD